MSWILYFSQLLQLFSGLLFFHVEFICCIQGDTYFFFSLSIKKGLFKGFLAVEK